MTTLEIILTIFIALIAGFCFGLVTGLKSVEYDDEDAHQERHEDIYCFQCEFEMSTKEKNGRLHCANCGLRH